MSGEKRDLTVFEARITEAISKAAESWTDRLRETCDRTFKQFQQNLSQKFQVPSKTEVAALTLLPKEEEVVVVFPISGDKDLEEEEDDVVQVVEMEPEVVVVIPTAAQANITNYAVAGEPDCSSTRDQRPARNRGREKGLVCCGSGGRPGGSGGVWWRSMVVECWRFRPGRSFEGLVVLEKGLGFSEKQKKLLVEATKGTLVIRSKQKDKLVGVGSDINITGMCKVVLEEIPCPLIYKETTFSPKEMLLTWSGRKVKGTTFFPYFIHPTQFCGKFFKRVGPIPNSLNFQPKTVHPQLIHQPNTLFHHPTEIFSTLIPITLRFHDHPLSLIFSALILMLHQPTLLPIWHSQSLLNGFTHHFKNELQHFQKSTTINFIQKQITRERFTSHLEDKVDVWATGSGEYGGYRLKPVYVPRLKFGVGGSVHAWSKSRTGRTQHHWGSFIGTSNMLVECLDSGSKTLCIIVDDRLCTSLGNGSCRLELIAMLQLELDYYARMVFYQGTFQSFLYIVTVMEKFGSSLNQNLELELERGTGTRWLQSCNTSRTLGVLTRGILKMQWRTEVGTLFITKNSQYLAEGSKVKHVIVDKELQPELKKLEATRLVALFKMERPGKREGIGMIEHYTCLGEPLSTLTTAQYVKQACNMHRGILVPSTIKVRADFYPP